MVGDKRFRCDRVDAIVSNPLYKGVIRHGDEEYPSEHPALVSRGVWEKANAALHPATGRSRFPLYKRDKHVHILKAHLMSLSARHADQIMKQTTHNYYVGGLSPYGP